MTELKLHSFHRKRQAHFAELNGQEVVEDYGDYAREYATLRDCACAIDLGFRGRICLLGKDRHKFLHGQVTNGVKDLTPGDGCYAAIVTAKGKVQSDLNIYCLEDELLLDFEPGLVSTVSERLQKFVVAEDVEIVDVTPHYGMWRLAGPKASTILGTLPWGTGLPTRPFAIVKSESAQFGEIYLARRPGPEPMAFDFFFPIGSLEDAANLLVAAVENQGGRSCGWRAIETLRIESAVPRFGADINDSILAPEAGLDERGISYAKGCYIGQEVIARIRTYGQVAKALRGLRLADPNGEIPAAGAKIFAQDKEVGFVTSAVKSPQLQAVLALGYVRKEANAPGQELTVEIGQCRVPAIVAALPFQPFT